MASKGKAFDSAVKRWEGIGPYYAMFPIRFADSVIKKYTSVGDAVLDPFAGRGTAIFSATALGRHGFGVEISPVGWVYAKTKLEPAPQEQVEKRLLDVLSQSKKYTKQAKSLPAFFKKCFSLSVRQFLLAARDNLDWRKCKSDRTLTSIILIYLHGKEGQALSNQMMQTKSMSPQYAINWWHAKGKKPPKIDVEEFILKRIRWRYAKGIIEKNGSQVFLGNSISLLQRFQHRLQKHSSLKINLLLTSPPYFGFTNYHYDQWLRLWLLGFETKAYIERGPYKGRFTNPSSYRKMLKNVFCHAAEIVNDGAVVYVRTSKDSFTKKATLDAMLEAFPNKRLVTRSRPFQNPTQTHLFGDKTPKVGEIDLILI